MKGWQGYYNRGGMTKINPTNYTKQARKQAKRILSAVTTPKAGDRISIVGLRIVTNEGNNWYTSDEFKTIKALLSHLGARAAGTGLDSAKFSAIALRFARRFSPPHFPINPN
ncbi:hypothetical protein UFOVP813_45 [uncultured Caudovirales phage]|uniref:Uncharacterized protein n=1 Tax=uncultured Caudovirales phage TaxID=2100421 RepID=A0A6J5P2Y2_9CAUD|nr:hypothetical protein UFOVP813_45 [uncultured Caudovirales phage]